MAAAAGGDTSLQWCAFFPDVEHEVRQGWLGGQSNICSMQLLPKVHQSASRHAAAQVPHRRPLPSQLSSAGHHSMPPQVLPVSSGHRLTLSYNLYSAARPPAAKAGGKRKAGEQRGLPTSSASLAAAAHAPQLSAERDAPGAVGTLRTLLADPAWHPEGAKLGVILGHKCAEAKWQGSGRSRMAAAVGKVGLDPLVPAGQAMLLAVTSHGERLLHFYTSMYAHTPAGMRQGWRGSKTTCFPRRSRWGAAAALQLSNGQGGLAGVL